MSFSYDPAQTESKDTVRFLIGDTESDSVLLHDEEIAKLLAGDANVYHAAASCAEALAARYARKVNISVDGLSTSWSDLSRQFMELAGRLRRQARDGGGVGNIGDPTVGGVSIAEMDAREANTDRPTDGFRIGMHENS